MTEREAITDALSDSTMERLRDGEQVELLVEKSDPDPLTSEKMNTIRKFLSDEAQERGFDGWVDAYHEMEVEE